jgi:hypothetical protein
MLITVGKNLAMKYLSVALTHRGLFTSVQRESARLPNPARELTKQASHAINKPL